MTTSRNLINSNFWQVANVDANGSVIGIESGSYSSGNSNIAIESNANITLSSNGVANVMTVSADTNPSTHTSTAIVSLGDTVIPLNNVTGLAVGRPLVAATFLAPGTLITDITSLNVTVDTPSILEAPLGTTFTSNNPTSLVEVAGNLTVAGESNLGPVGNVTITGGSNGQALFTDGAGNLSWVTISADKIVNGNSNVVVAANANVTISSNGVANVVSVSAAIITNTYTTTATANTGDTTLTVDTVTGLLVGDTLINAVVLSPSTVVTNVNGLIVTVDQPLIANAAIGATFTTVENTSQVTLADAFKVTGKSNLNAVGNVTITGGTTGQFLKTDGNGNLSWGTVGTSALNNGNSNVVVGGNTAVTTSANGLANILVVNSNGTHGQSTFKDDVTITGNLNVQGTATYINTTSQSITDPIFDVGVGANNTPLVTDDALDRGMAMHSYGVGADYVTNGSTPAANTFIAIANTVGIVAGMEIGDPTNGTLLTKHTTVVTVNANSNIEISNPTLGIIPTATTLGIGQDIIRFVGWDTGNVEMVVASNVSISNNVLTVNELGNTRLGTLIGRGNIDYLADVVDSAMNFATDAENANITLSTANANSAIKFLSNGENSVIGIASFGGNTPVALATNGVSSNITIGTVGNTSNVQITTTGLDSHIALTTTGNSANILQSTAAINSRISQNTTGNTSNITASTSGIESQILLGTTGNGSNIAVSTTGVNANVTLGTSGNTSNVLISTGGGSGGINSQIILRTLNNGGIISAATVGTNANIAFQTSGNGANIISSVSGTNSRITFNTAGDSGNIAASTAGANSGVTTVTTGPTSTVSVNTTGTNSQITLGTSGSGGNIAATTNNTNANVTLSTGGSTSNIVANTTGVNSQIVLSTTGSGGNITATTSNVNANVRFSTSGNTSNILANTSGVNSQIVLSTTGTGGNITATTSNVNANVTFTTTGNTSTISSSTSGTNSQITLGTTGSGGNIAATTNNTNANITFSTGGITSNILANTSGVNSQIVLTTSGSGGNITATTSNVNANVTFTTGGNSSNILASTSGVNSEIGLRATGTGGDINISSTLGRVTITGNSLALVSNTNMFANAANLRSTITSGNGNIANASFTVIGTNANATFYTQSVSTNANANVYIVAQSIAQGTRVDVRALGSDANASSIVSIESVGVNAAVAIGASVSSANSNVVVVTPGTVTIGATSSIKYANVSNVASANASNVYYPLVLDAQGVITKEPVVATLSPVISNTLTTPPSTPAVDDAYLIPNSGVGGAWLGQNNKIATWTGSAWSYYTPNTNDQTSVLSGTNAGNVYLYNGTAWVLQTVNTGVPVYNWSLSSSYTLGSVVIYQNSLYQANAIIPANTAFVVGTTGATWKALSSAGGLQPTTGVWSVAPGTASYSFTLPSGLATYSMWVLGSIPNGILAWNCTATFTNTNTYAVGLQSAWYYSPGNALVLNSIPNVIVGTAGAIVNPQYGGGSSTTLTFSITNSSGAIAPVTYGYIKIGGI
jgi:hypothetical protein